MLQQRRPASAPKGSLSGSDVHPAPDSSSLLPTFHSHHASATTAAAVSLASLRRRFFSQQSPAFRLALCLLFVPVALLAFLSIPARLYGVFNPAVPPCSLLLPSDSFSLPALSSSEDRSDSESVPSADSVSSFKVPLLFHTQVRDPSFLPSHHLSWLSAFPSPSSHMYWTDAACLSLITDHYPDFLPVYEAYGLNIQRLDSCRYHILDRHGGIYKDGDLALVLPTPTATPPPPTPTTPTRPSSSALAPRQDGGGSGGISSSAAAVLPSETSRPNYDKYAVRLLRQLPSCGVGVIESPYKYNEDVQNSFMSSVPGHAFWKEIVFPLLRERRDVKGVLMSTGPGLLTEAIRRWEERINRLNAGDEEGDKGRAAGSRASASSSDGSQHRPAGLKGGEEEAAESDKALLSTSASGPTGRGVDGGVVGGGSANCGVVVLRCELFQRVPLGVTSTTLLNVIGREVLSRLYPMKQCGDFHREDDCQITRHYGAASWTTTTIK